MRKTLFLVVLSTISACTSCSSSFTAEEQSNKTCGSSPSARVMEYQGKLRQHDFVGVNRLYSKRLLEIKLDNQAPKDCKKVEDCVTAANRLAGFEISLSDGKDKTAKEIPTTDADRVRVLTTGALPYSVKINYELVREDGNWYVDKAFWENGETIPGFEEIPLTKGGISVSTVSP